MLQLKKKSVKKKKENISLFPEETGNLPGFRVITDEAKRSKIFLKMKSFFYTLCFFYHF